MNLFSTPSRLLGLCLVLIWTSAFGILGYYLAQTPWGVPFLPSSACSGEDAIWLDLIDGSIERICVKDLLAIGKLNHRTTVWVKKTDQIVPYIVADPVEELLTAWIEDYGFVLINGNSWAVNPAHFGWLAKGAIKPVPGVINLDLDCVNCLGDQRGGVVISSPASGLRTQAQQKSPLIFGVSSALKDSVLADGSLPPYFGKQE